jgi:iron(III) transport system ATP-binding protein
MSAAGLHLEDVTHRYGERVALHQVSLSVAPGEVLCVLGPSGCGKTTLLRLAAGLERLREGRILIGNRLVASGARVLPPEQRNVGMVFQDVALFPHMSVLDNVAFGIRDGSGAARRERALAALERVALAARARSYPHALSGGEQQRVALARALAPAPAVMLLDEPFGGLDTRLRQRVREESVTLLRESGAAVLLVTHDPEEAATLGDRIAVMANGKLEQVGTPEHLYQEPESAFVARFLGEANVFEATVDGAAVQTPLGAVPVPGVRSGDAVQVLIRPESLRLVPTSVVPEEKPRGAVPVIVERVRRNGPLTAVEVRFPDQQGSGDRATALELGAARWTPGERAYIVLDTSGAHVFPLEGSHAGT